MLEHPILDSLAVFLFVMNPVIFISGVFILLAPSQKYNKLESSLGKDMGGITKRIFPAVETNIYSIHNRIIQRKVIIGLICIIYSIAIFLFKKQIIFFIDSIK